MLRFGVCPDLPTPTLDQLVYYNYILDLIHILFFNQIRNAVHSWVPVPPTPSLYHLKPLCTPQNLSIPYTPFLLHPFHPLVLTAYELPVETGVLLFAVRPVVYSV
jgi:hypothetical protein